MFIVIRQVFFFLSTLSVKKRKYRDNDEVSETIDLSMKKRKISENQEILAVDSNVPSIGNNDGEDIEKLQLRSSSFKAVCFRESYDQSYCSDHVESYQKVEQNDNQPESSDSDDVELPPLPKLKDLNEEELCEKEMKICKLREELRNEEVKLVLLKKLRQSQTVKDNMLSATQPLPGKIAPPASRNVQSSSGSIFLDRGRHSVLSGKIFEQNAPQHPLTVSQMIRNQNLQGSSSVLMGSKSGLHSTLPANVMLQQSVMRPGMGPLSRTHVTTPPNVVMGYPASNRSNSHQINNGHTLSLAQSSASISPQTTQGSERIENQTPAQRQAVAKLALRKQLEKTLLQIPPPKPPPPEMHFIPNANNQEFVCLLGLEKVVDFMMHDSTATKSPPDPFFCIQCGTDFTPVWKWQDTLADFGKKKTSVICETCVTTNIKKALKAEHTNRLKTAFVKALQQEQEIEQNMSLVVPSPPPSTSPLTQPLSSIPTTVFSNSHGTPPPSSHSPIPRIGISNPSAAAAAVATAAANSAALLQQLPKLTPAQQSILQAQAHQLHQLAQGLPHQPQPAHMLPFSPLLPQAYSYQMLGKPAVTSTDLQRQYLLDMIPSRSLPQNSMNWKS
ncbi:transcriptional repressor p66-beta-like isoform X2 [Limulus polyphemus]|uniref:Transcriptional repressor p66-beta-like isoform X2 n=1 Tax=Limulus polyphemus TaxID=6850 RepID=A0ABM1SNX0_LIMPO|nr:transcriptional repressor p66-beta-like isoform X2 [Limulus polyphemus]